MVQRGGDELWLRDLTGLNRVSCASGQMIDNKGRTDRVSGCAGDSVEHVRARKSTTGSAVWGENGRGGYDKRQPRT